jgi:WD repeat-containing protein 68
MFDLRNLEHSTIVYETPDSTPLLRLAWNKQDPNYLATFQMDSSKVVVLDVRVPSVPVTELHGHSGPLNSIAWAPHSSAHICTAGQDSQVLVWDLSQMRKYIQDPILCYESPMETNSISWSRLQPDWVAIAYGDTLEALRI